MLIKIFLIYAKHILNIRKFVEFNRFFIVNTKIYKNFKISIY